jgi:hypothetical protein
MAKIGSHLYGVGVNGCARSGIAAENIVRPQFTAEMEKSTTQVASAGKLEVGEVSHRVL